MKVSEAEKKAVTDVVRDVASIIEMEGRVVMETEGELTFGAVEDILGAAVVAVAEAIGGINAETLNGVCGGTVASRRLVVAGGNPAVIVMFPELCCEVQHKCSLMSKHFL